MAIDLKNQRNQLLLFTIVAALAAAYAYHTYVWTPKSEELAVVEERVTRLEELNEKARRDVQRGNLGKLKAENLRLQAQLNLMQQLVPKSNEVPVLLDQVSTAARRVGLELAAVEPVAGTTGESFDIYRYRIGVAGDYHAVAQFLVNVGSLTRIVLPMNLTLQMTPRDPRPKKDRQRLDARMEIQTFVSKRGTGPVATPAAGAGAR